uniref:Uncharacterized protein n=1 Tax=Lepeophtheirus salmonis TaxID=72036 RepID=A0A0K2T205_LEPSM
MDNEGTHLTSNYSLIKMKKYHDSSLKGISTIGI